MSRGLHRLTDLAETLVKSVDDHADKIAGELQQSHDRCARAIDGIQAGVGKPLDDAAKAAEDMLNQLSNSPPPETGSPDSAPTDGTS